MPEPSARSRVCNVLVIGAGAAGLRAAIAATEAGSQVLIVGKRHRLVAHTVSAGGGLLPRPSTGGRDHGSGGAGCGARAGLLGLPLRHPRGRPIGSALLWRA